MFSVYADTLKKSVKMSKYITTEIGLEINLYCISHMHNFIVFGA